MNVEYEASFLISNSSDYLWKKPTERNSKSISYNWRQLQDRSENPVTYVFFQDIFIAKKEDKKSATLSVNYIHQPIYYDEPLGQFTGRNTTAHSEFVEVQTL